MSYARKEYTLLPLIPIISILGLIPASYGQVTSISNITIVPSPTEDTSGLLPEEEESEISMQIQLQPNESNGLADSRNYRIQSLQMTADNAEEICPTMNCQYEIENGEFRPNLATGGYVLDGQLKATTTEGDIKRSTFSELYAPFTKSGSTETPSNLTEFLEGSIGFGGTFIQPEINYQVENGTFNVKPSPTLILQGKSTISK